jgi:uncharacterized membrane protein required for colicin V production
MGWVFMNAVDILLIIALCGGMVIGFFRGLVRTTVNMVILYLVTVVGAFSYPYLGRWLAYPFPTAGEQLRNAAAFLFIVLLFYNAITLSIRPTMKKRQEKRGMPVPGCLDKLGGIVVGFFFAGIWIGLSLLLFQFLLSVPWVNWEPLRNSLSNGISSSPLATVFRVGLLPMVLASLKPWFAPFGGLPDLFILR